MKLQNDINKVVVKAFLLLHNQYNISLKFAALKESVKRYELFTFDFLNSLSFHRCYGSCAIAAIK